MSELPKFIPQVPAGNFHAAFDPLSPPPYKFDDVRFTVFPLHASKAKLQQCCDRFINNVPKPSAALPFRLEPIQSLVLLEVLDYPVMRSTFPGQSKLGFSSQKECFFAIPVVKRVNGLAVAVGLFVPFIFVDNDWSLVSGRDVVGFAKLRGEIDMPVLSGLSQTQFKPMLSVRAFHQFIAESKSEVRPLVEYAGGLTPFAAQLIPQQADADRIWPFGPIEQLYGDAAPGNDLAPVDDDVFQLLTATSGSEVAVPNYMFRQYRDAVEPERACYQEILEARMSITGFGAVQAFGPGLKVRVNRFASLDLGTELGLQAIDTATAPIASFTHSASLRFSIRERVYASCGGPADAPPPPRSCPELICAAARLTAGTAVRQSRVGAHMAGSVLRGDLRPAPYANDLRTVAANAIDYGDGLRSLALEGARHVLSLPGSR
jgi:hypothetical protein